jgi:hypothetical protein
VFFGGTALSRTLLPNLRLCEDIDLFALADRRALGRSSQTSIEQLFQRSFGAATCADPGGGRRANGGSSPVGNRRDYDVCRILRRGRAPALRLADADVAPSACRIGCPSIIFQDGVVVMHFECDVT